ncbi:hypothetical protein FPSE_00501 [Fusarium pseudograminearum CS3096]|uniref:Uncharacterized protein n=1 Tax=Fusarium pseudograminearum (strain CS3096) TaxID=1028729 RepID=K3V2A0_FUSPC|nr:hypothetical protein FPSE_00501 [Fusarium pseudograminearum CS3096]EKJ79361.1 hypothetical protein FPSE_00501 [Fusarium pseudograminearum CS3096]
MVVTSSQFKLEPWIQKWGNVRFERVARLNAEIPDHAMNEDQRNHDAAHT